MAKSASRLKGGVRGVNAVHVGAELGHLQTRNKFDFYKLFLTTFFRNSK